MDDQQQRSRWRTILRRAIWTVLILAALVLALWLAYNIYYGYRYEWKWTGMVEDPDFHKRTLWDWLELLIIPFVIAVLGTVGGYLFTRSENRVAQALTDRRTQDEALQAYLDQIGTLLLDSAHPLRGSKAGDEVRILARSRTLTVLGRLDGSKKRSVLGFLYESQLIRTDAAVVRLTDADLSDANLGGATLRGANLKGANLRRADLRGADLRGANLSYADLTNADLRQTKLQRADLRRARGANVSRDAYLRDTIMPNGEKAKESRLL